MVPKKDRPDKGKSIQRLQRAHSAIAVLRQTRHDSPQFTKRVFPKRVMKEPIDGPSDGS